MGSKKLSVRHPQKEAERRFKAAVRGALSGPATPLKKLRLKSVKSQRINSRQS